MMLIGDQCVLCEVGKFKTSFGIKSCDLCEEFVQGSTTDVVNATSKSQCRCPKGTYLDLNQKVCIDVEAGMNSTSFGSTIFDIAVLAGYWRISNITDDVRECPVSKACLGGVKTSKYCKEGHEGPYCNLCEEGFSKDVFKMCQKCKASTQNIVGTVLTVVGIIVLVAGVYVLQKRLKRNEKVQAAMKAVKCAIKILFVTYQILATLPSIVPSMKLPANFSAFLGSIQFANVNLFEMISVGCLTTGFNYYKMLLCATIFPLGLIGILVTIGLAIVKFRAQCFTLALAISYVVLPTVTTIIFGAFPCDVFVYGSETDSFLRADYSISCEDASYRTFKVFGGLMLLLIPVGIPLTYAVILWRRKEKIKRDVEEREKDDALMTVAFLFDSYKPEYWYFEIFETCRRLALTGALGAIKPGTITQLAFGMLLSLCGIMVYCCSMPYNNKRDNLLQILSNLQIFLVMLTALVLKYRPRQDVDSFDEKGLGVLLIILNVLGVLSLLVFGAFKLIIPKTAEEIKNRGSNFVDVFTGRKKGERTNSGNEVHRIDQDGGIELGDVYKNSGKAVGKEEFKGSENPMRFDTLADKIGVPGPPEDWAGYAKKEYKGQREMKKKELEIIRKFEVGKGGGEA